MTKTRPLPRMRTAQAARGWFSIRNSVSGPAQVQIYNEIGVGGITAKAFADQLSDVDAAEIELRLNSIGGEVFDGIAIHHAIRNHPAQVNVIVDGVAASIASVIAMAGDTVTMARGSQMMIHEGHTVAVGAAADMRRCADLLDKTSNTIAGFYAVKAGGSVEQWRGRMRAETWYDADEAVKARLADKVAAPTRQVRASFDLTVFNYAGRRAAPAPDLSHGPDGAGNPAPPPPPPSKNDIPVNQWSDLVGPLLKPTSPTSDDVLAALREAL